MRRFVYWYLPIAATIVGTVLFAYGLVSFLRGDTGSRVEVLSSSRAPLAAAAPRNVIAPIILGDSVARGTGDESGLGIGGRLDAELQRRHVGAKKTVNVAINGARTPNLREQLDSRNVRTLVAQANVVIVSIGGNDLWGAGNWRSAPPPDPDALMGGVLDAIGEIVHTIRDANPTARIFLVGLYNPFDNAPFGRALTPLVNRWNAKLIDRFANDPRITVVQTADIFAFHNRLAADAFHPGGEGYELIARRIADAL